MLQQTTVKTVENKIPEIINIFPNFNSFNNKKLEHLLKVWSGLGYYNRAENLFKAEGYGCACAISLMGIWKYEVKSVH